MRIVTPDEMRALEARYMEVSGEDSVKLMGRAAARLRDEALRLVERDNWPPEDCNIPHELSKLTGITTAVFCGPGANGGDGWAVARRLFDLNSRVVILTMGLPEPGSAARHYYERCIGFLTAMRIVDISGSGMENCEDGARMLDYVVSRCGEAQICVDLCVDALFGTGLSRPLSGGYLGMARMMRLLKLRGARVLAVDMPSGVNGLTGEDGGACPADVTVTFQFIKRGQLLGAGQDACGELLCRDIGIPPSYAPQDAPLYIAPCDIALERRRHDSYKGSYGHLMLIAGSKSYAGAALLSTGAALRAGAGLVTAASVRYIVPLMQLRAPSAMALDAGAGDVLDAASADIIRAALPGKTALAIGPGLTRSAAPEVLRAALKSRLPSVLDADALNIISEHGDLRAALHGGCVLTPHPGEMARLLGRRCGDPVQDAHELARELGCTVLLKGGATCVSDGTRDFIMTPGAPGMACGGSGDVLTGVIGALLAQGMEPLRAALTGGLMHGRAGQLAQRRLGEIAMNASDIIDDLPGAFMEATGERAQETRECTRFAY